MGMTHRAFGQEARSDRRRHIWDIPSSASATPTREACSITRDRGTTFVLGVALPLAGFQVSTTGRVRGRHLGGYKAPREMSFHADLPRDAAGKLLKRVFREPHWAGRRSRV
jgi:acyl-CoA synthetase (AMP-forming)/AMP-acid ligase II